MEQLIKELLNKGIPISGVSLIDDELAYEIPGFYKSGTITLFTKDDKIFAKARYNELTEIHGFENLVRLNYEWWDYSKDRFEGWKTPDGNWLPYLIEFNLVTRQEQIVYT